MSPSFLVINLVLSHVTFTSALMCCYVDHKKVFEYIQRNKLGAEEVAQWLRTPVALAEVLGSILRTSWWFTAIFNFQVLLWYAFIHIK